MRDYAVEYLNEVQRILTQVLETQTEAIHTVREDVSRLDGKVDALERKPGKRWENLADKLLWGVVGAVLTWFLARMGI